MIKERTNPLLSFAFLILVFLSAIVSEAKGSDGNGWKAGVAQVKITPKESIWIAGYIDRNHPSEGKLNDLWAKALAIEDNNGKQAVLITTDLVGIQKSMSDTIRDRLKRKYNLSRAQVNRRNNNENMQYGNELGCAVKRVLDEKMIPLVPDLSTAYSEINLQLEASLSKEELLQKVENSSGYEQRWYKEMLDQLNLGKPFPVSYPYPVQVWKLGGQIVVALGGEPTIEYTLKLKELLGQGLFVLGYSNDVMAYIPSSKVLKEGGYEGKISQMYYRIPGKWDSVIEEKILREVKDLAVQVGADIPEQLQRDTVEGHKSLVAKHYSSGFPLAHDTYSAISAAGNGKIYYVLSSQSIDIGGQMYAYAPTTDQTTFVTDLTEACGEKGLKAISQGKSHVRFYEMNGKLYVNSIGIGANGDVYTLTRFEHEGKEIEDLVIIPNPFSVNEK